MNSLSVDIGHIPIIYQPPPNIMTRHINGRVHLYVGNRGIDLNTVVAHKIGMTIVKAVPGLEPNELIVLNINNEKIKLLGPLARRVAVALLRKADDADTWQLNGGKT